MSDETIYKAEQKRGSLQLPMPAVALIGGGILLLVLNLLDISLMNYLWPGFILGFGLLLMWPSFRSTAAHPHTLSFLAVPGALFVMLGVLFLFMNLFNRFNTMAYAWPLVIAAVGGGLMYMNRFNPDHTIHKSGRRFVRAMVIIFMGLATLFEFFVFRSFGPWWPLFLVVAGIYLFVKDKRDKGEN